MTWFDVGFSWPSCFCGVHFDFPSPVDCVVMVGTDGQWNCEWRILPALSVGGGQNAIGQLDAFRGSPGPGRSSGCQLGGVDGKLMERCKGGVCVGTLQ